MTHQEQTDTPLTAKTLQILRRTCSAVHPPHTHYCRVVCGLAGRDLWYGSPCNTKSNTHIHKLAIWSPSAPEWWLGFKVGQGPDWRTYTRTHPYWVTFSLIFILCGFFKNSRLIQWNEQLCESVTCPSLYLTTRSSLSLLLSHSKAGTESLLMFDLWLCMWMELVKWIYNTMQGDTAQI